MAHTGLKKPHPSLRATFSLSPRGEGSTHWFSVIEIALPLLLEGIQKRFGLFFPKRVHNHSLF